MRQLTLNLYYRKTSGVWGQSYQRLKDVPTAFLRVGERGNIKMLQDVYRADTIFRPRNVHALIQGGGYELNDVGKHLLRILK